MDTRRPAIEDTLELADLMLPEQAKQLLAALDTIIHSPEGRGVVLVVCNNRHVRWFLSAKLEDFALPEEYRK